jgi:hypothetical protein
MVEGVTVATPTVRMLFTLFRSAREQGTHRTAECHSLCHQSPLEATRAMRVTTSQPRPLFLPHLHKQERQRWLCESQTHLEERGPAGRCAGSFQSLGPRLSFTQDSCSFPCDLGTWPLPAPSTGFQLHPTASSRWGSTSGYY